MPGVPSGVPHERLRIEVRVREVLGKIAAEVLGGALELVATHPRDHVAFHPDPIPLARLTGPDRICGEMPRETGPVANLRFHNGCADPNQLSLLKSRDAYSHPQPHACQPLKDGPEQKELPAPPGTSVGRRLPGGRLRKPTRAQRGSVPINCARYGGIYSTSRVSAFIRKFPFLRRACPLMRRDMAA
jgi:hypothetical protein